MKQRIRTSAVRVLVSVAFVLALSPSSVNAQDKKPNFVMIMTDDVGWGDLGSYGGGIMRGAPTPNLDRMAAEGMRFLSYYGQASCTAGRASFITGRIPIRTSLSSVLTPGDPNGLTSETPTHGRFPRTRHVAEICHLSEFLLFIIVTGANTESAVASGIPSAQTITDSSSPTPPRSVAEARSSPRTSTRRTQPLLFCAAPFRQLLAPQSAIAVRPPR
jgi:hypothetical protein